MSFTFVAIKETDKLKDVYPKINSIGQELSKPNNIYKQLSDLKTLVAGYQTYKLTNSQGQYTTGQAINLDTVQGSKTVYGTITEPPEGTSGEGWISYKESENSTSVEVQFDPIDNDGTFKKIRKLPKQPQNPNMLKDTLFREVVSKDINGFNSIINWDANTSTTGVKVPAIEETYRGHNVATLYDAGGSYPMLRHKGLAVGTDVKVGDTLTFSAYAKVPNAETLLENYFFIEICGYSDELGTANTTIARTEVYKVDVVVGEWVKLTVTATVPATINDLPIQYISALLRVGTNISGRNNGFKVYYALPKLEKGSVATPYVSHVEDKLRFNELWTEWIEHKDTVELNKYVPVDMHNRGYLNYEWTPAKSGGRTFKDLLDTVPQGFYTFYLSASIPGAPSNKHVRGTITVNYYANDPTRTEMIRTVVQCVDTDGVSYTMYKEGDVMSVPLRNSGAVELWTGTQDMSNTSYIFNLNDNIYNYDYIEVDYYTYSDKYLDNKRRRIYADTSSVTLNTTRIASAMETNSGFDFWQAQLDISNNTQMKANYSKRVSVNSSGTSSVNGRNTSGLFTIKKIMGFKG